MTSTFICTCKHHKLTHYGKGEECQADGCTCSKFEESSVHNYNGTLTKKGKALTAEKIMKTIGGSRHRGRFHMELVLARKLSSADLLLLQELQKEKANES